MRRGFATAWLALVGCATRVQHGLDERQANEIQTVLVERGFAARKVLEDGRPPTWAVEVAGAESSEAVRVLAGLGLPRPRPAGVKELLRPGLVPDPLEQHVLLLEAQSGELARTLESVDGVLSARVHVVRPTPARGGGTSAPAKAAVYLRVQSAAHGRLSGMRDELRALVAGAVEGLEPSGVTLVLSEVAWPVVARAPDPPAGPWSAPLLSIGVAALVTAVATAGWGVRRFVVGTRTRAAAPAVSLAVRPRVQSPLGAGGE